MIHSTNKSNFIVFIDSQVNDYNSLMAGVDAKTTVVILNNSQNGIEQITKALTTDTYTEVHIISHGSPGCLYLGNSQFNLDTLDEYREDLENWSDQLSIVNCPLSIALYGCNVAAGDAGAEFIARLKEFTGAEIAATKTLTGNQAMGGDWELETTTSNLTVNLAIAASVREAYQGVLADFVVTTANDENDGDVDGDDLSLREAIIAANNTPGADTITFDNSINQINLASETLSITDSLTINGSGANSLTIDGGNQDFAVITIGDDDLNATINVTIDGVTISGGNNIESGGGIRNLENLALNNSVVSGNASGKDGGGIFNLVGTLTTDNTIISDNTAAYGGGVSNYFGSTSLTNSTISGNTAGNGGGIYNYAGATVAVYSKIEDNSAQTGGGISNYNGAIAVVTSVISGNTASENGGGIYNEEGQATVTLSYVRDNNSGNFGGGIASQNEASTTIVTSSIVSGNTADFGAGVSNYQGDVSVSASTISGNQANIEGGGVNNYFGTSNLTNSTISGNSAIAGGGVSNFNGQTTIVSSTIANNAAYYGSGIINYYSQTILASTIVAGNQNSPDILGTFFTSGGNNLIGGRGDVTTLIDGENNDLVGTTDNPIDPLLGDLQDNGGLTPTQALLPGSPAIDQGADLGGIDQRGGDFVRPVGLGNDIGAFEVQNPYSTPEDDYLVGGINDNLISAQEGNDIIFGLDGNDTLNGDAGNDTISGGNDEDRITGGAGNDLIQGNGDRDILNGNNGNDTIIGGDGNDTLNGGNGIDILLGSEGNDSLWGGKGRDTLNGGTGNDILRGHDDDDLLNGGEGEDQLYGANGNDILNGGTGNDTISGGAGNDLIIGGEGKDALHGGAGNDIFFLDSHDNDFIADFTDGIDRFQLPEGLHFGSLSFHDTFNNSGTIIKDASNDYEIVATVKGIHAADLNAHDFTNP